MLKFLKKHLLDFGVGFTIGAVSFLVYDVFHGGIRSEDFLLIGVGAALIWGGIQLRDDGSGIDDGSNNRVHDDGSDN